MALIADDRPGLRRPPQFPPSQYAAQLQAAKSLGLPELFVMTKSHDGNKSVEKVESEVLLLWPCVQKEIFLHKRGKTEDSAISLPSQVGHETLKLLLEYCRFHKFPGRSDKERKIFDEKFIRLDTRRLCELTSAADSLEMKTLVELSSRALARMIEGKTPEEIRETFHLPDDLTEEEKLEPVKNVADDPRIRLLNRLYAKKRKELAEKKEELLRMEAGVGKSAPQPDTRPLDDLLSFIQEDKSTQGKGRGKKKKNKKKRESITGKDESASAQTAGEDLSSQSGELADIANGSVLHPADMIDGLSEQAANAALAWLDGNDYNAELDDEILAFERSLNADWEERRLELMQTAGILDSEQPQKAMKPLDDLILQASKLAVNKVNSRLPVRENTPHRDRQPEHLPQSRLAESDAAQSSGAFTPLRPVFLARKDPDQQYPEARSSQPMTPDPGTPATLPSASGSNPNLEAVQHGASSEQMDHSIQTPHRQTEAADLQNSQSSVSEDGQPREMLQITELQSTASQSPGAEDSPGAESEGTSIGKELPEEESTSPGKVNGHALVSKASGLEKEEVAVTDQLKAVLSELAGKLGFEAEISVKKPESGNNMNGGQAQNGTESGEWSLSRKVEGLGTLSIGFTPPHRKVQQRS